MDPFIGFTGAYRDPIMHAYPLGNGYRWYMPALLRFNMPDSLAPFGRGGINPYAYCADDPINHSDPTGHQIIGVEEDIEEAVMGMQLGVLHASSKEDKPIPIKKVETVKTGEKLDPGIDPAWRIERELRSQEEELARDTWEEAEKQFKLIRVEMDYQSHLKERFDEMSPYDPERLTLPLPRKLMSIWGFLGFKKEVTDLIDKVDEITRTTAEMPTEAKINLWGQTQQYLHKRYVEALVGMPSPDSFKPDHDYWYADRFIKPLFPE